MLAQELPPKSCIAAGARIAAGAGARIASSAEIAAGAGAGIAAGARTGNLHASYQVLVYFWLPNKCAKRQMYAVAPFRRCEAAWPICTDFTSKHVTRN